MRRIITIGLAVIALALPGTAASADGNGACRQAANNFLVGLSDEGTRGDYQSDVLFGNEPNMANGALGGPSEQAPGTQAGNVVSSQSPGPFVNTGANPPPRNDRTMGFGGGDLQALVKAACN